MKENWVYRRGDLYLANLGVPGGSKQGGVRPVVVLQNDVGNYYAPTITIAPLTSKIEKKRKQPTHFFLRKAKGLAKPSMVLAEQLDTCDKICVIRYLGRVSKDYKEGSCQYTGNQCKNTGCCKNRRFDLLCSVCGKRLRLFHGSGDSGVHCKMYAPCKTDGTCCDISQTSKLSAVKIDIVEYGR